MDNFYVACDLGVQEGRVVLGTLRKGGLMVSEVHRFQNLPIEEKSSRFWNIRHLYAEIMTGLREIGTYQEHINSISFNAWGGDYMLFDPDGSLSTPVHHHSDSDREAGMREILAKVSAEEIYNETGVISQPGDTLFQLALEKSRRLNHAGQILPIADGFNYLLSGTPCVEMSSAGNIQLFNPFTKTWSEQLPAAVRLPTKVLPAIVPAGTKLGALRETIAEETKLDDTQVIATCSHEISAALAGLPIGAEDNWAFIRQGSQALIGAGLKEPIVNDASRDSLFSNQIGYGGSVGFHKETMGLWVLEECKHFWKGPDHDIDWNMLLHFAGDSTPFESLVDLSDPQFLTPGDMPLKIQAYCRETNQAVPRKQGAILRCILESLALLYRKNLCEIETLTESKITKLFVLDGQEINLLNHFTANALQIPVVVVPSGASAIGNLMVQSLALGHVRSLAEAREVIKNSIKTKTIAPHANNWGEAYDRFSRLGAPASAR